MPNPLLYELAPQSDEEDDEYDVWAGTTWAATVESWLEAESLEEEDDELYDDDESWDVWADDAELEDDDDASLEILPILIGADMETSAALHLSFL